MKSTELLFHLMTFLALGLSSARADPDNFGHLPSERLRWSAGPTTVALREVASLRIPAGYAFLNGTQSRALLESLGNKTSGSEVGLVASESQDWSVVIEFHPVGYVSEEGGEALDAAAVLAAIRATDQRANAGRERNGWAAVEVRDWESKPLYDPANHSMEWAVRAESEGISVINRVVSVLGRRGVVQFIQVDRHRSTAAASTLRRLVGGLAFEPGERYVDRQPGDLTAVGGLMGLVGSVDPPEPFEPAPNHASGSIRRASLPADYWWLVGTTTGLVGFLIGRRFRRHRRIHRSPRAVFTDRGAPPLPASTCESTSLICGGGAGVGGTPRTPLPLAESVSSDTGRTRHRRCDAYSFYARLTRDLHWTIHH